MADELNTVKHQLKEATRSEKSLTNLRVSSYNLIIATCFLSLTLYCYRMKQGSGNIRNNC